ncbi:hypothetical protein EXS45_01885 [Candidatus Nomurabacteria bacterium]|nr:hypothetical protein [Candidatus Nomurabacteria bacterium]
MQFIKQNLYKNKIILTAFLFIVPIFSFAQGTVSAPCDTSGKICNPLGPNGIESIPGFIHTLLVGVLKIGMPIVALAIIYSGFLFVSARGNSEKLTKAKDTLLYTLIGAAILLGSWAIAELISETVIGISN